MGKTDETLMKEFKDFTICEIDNGFCRIGYRAKNADDQTVYYCLQDEGKNYGGVICYRCSTDMEPNYQINYPKDKFEIPTGNSDIEIVVREYLEGAVIWDIEVK